MCSVRACVCVCACVCVNRLSPCYKYKEGEAHTQNDDEQEVDVRESVKLFKQIDRDEREVPEGVLRSPHLIVLR